jgi:hypothetical protein
VRPEVLQVLQRLQTTAAMVTNGSCATDLRAVMGATGLLEAEPANLTRYVFTDPRARAPSPTGTTSRTSRPLPRGRASGAGAPEEERTRLSCPCLTARLPRARPDAAEPAGDRRSPRSVRNPSRTFVRAAVAALAVAAACVLAARGSGTSRPLPR